MAMSHQSSLELLLTPEECSCHLFGHRSPSGELLSDCMAGVCRYLVGSWLEALDGQCLCQIGLWVWVTNQDRPRLFLLKIVMVSGVC
jgi:hypothetical protein